MTTFFGYPVKLALEVEGETIDVTDAIDMLAMPPTIRPDAIARHLSGGVPSDLERLRVAVNEYLLAQNNRGHDAKCRDERRRLCEVVYEINAKADAAASGRQEPRGGRSER